MTCLTEPVVKIDRRWKIISFIVRMIPDSKRQQTTTVDNKRLINGLFLTDMVILQHQKRTAMSNQRRNRVKLNKKYKSIGRIPNSALNKISNYIELPSRVQTIRASIGNTVKHNHRHMNEMEEQLSRLGITKEGYAEFVAKNFNQIRLGNKPLSLVLAVLLEKSNHIAAIHLHYDKNEQFWLVTTVHAIKLSDLEKIPLIWEK